MSWKAKAEAAIVDLRAALASKTDEGAKAHLQDAQGMVTAAIDALDDAGFARASEAE